MQIARRNEDGKLQLLFHQGVHAEPIWKDCDWQLDLLDLQLAEPFRSLAKRMDGTAQNEMIGELLMIKAPHKAASIAAVITSHERYNEEVMALITKYAPKTV